jgi:hypothetical protein
MLVEGHQAAVSSAQHCHLGKGTKVIYDTLAAAVAPMTAPQWNLKQQNSRSVVPLSAHTPGIWGGEFCCLIVLQSSVQDQGGHSSCPPWPLPWLLLDTGDPACRSDCCGPESSDLCLYLHETAV